MELDDFFLSDEVDVAAAPGNLVMPEWKNLHLLKFMNTNCFLVNAVMFITSILFFHFIVWFWYVFFLIYKLGLWH